MIPDGLGNLEEMAVFTEDSGIVDQDVDTAETPHRVVNQSFYVGTAGDVGFDKDGSSADTLQLGLDMPPGLRVLLGDDNRCPFFNKMFGYRTAEPAAGSGNDGDFVLQPHLCSFHYELSVYSSHLRLATGSVTFGGNAGLGALLSAQEAESYAAHNGQVVLRINDLGADSLISFIVDRLS